MKTITVTCEKCGQTVTRTVTGGWRPRYCVKCGRMRQGRPKAAPKPAKAQMPRVGCTPCEPDGRPMCEGGIHLRQEISQPQAGWQVATCLLCGARRHIPFWPLGRAWGARTR